jgi:rare lipoprotein A
MRTALGFSCALLLVSTTAMAAESRPGHHHATPSAKAKSGNNTKTAAHSTSRRQSRQPTRLASRTPRRAAARDEEALPPPDEYVGPMQVVGPREVGSAAWYGGYHLGRRTASGERLDGVHATAAHRSLPLDSLVRVTNLRNGRSIICRITDRGPVSRSLLIDVSPRVARQLDMVRSGIATVAVEPVAPAARPQH